VTYFTGEGSVALGFSRSSVSVDKEGCTWRARGRPVGGRNACVAWVCACVCGGGGFPLCLCLCSPSSSLLTLPSSPGSPPCHRLLHRWFSG
jgi:hypothetical protein